MRSLLIFEPELPDRKLKNQNFILENQKLIRKGTIFEKPSGYYDTLLRQNALLSCCLLIHTLFSKAFP
jgi:hypothetical protein